MMYNGGNATEEQGKVDKLSFSFTSSSWCLGGSTSTRPASIRERCRSVRPLYPGWLTAHLIGTSLLIAFALLKIDVSFYETYAFLFYLVGIALLVLTLIVAEEINGSRSWLILGPVHSNQPSS